MKKNSCDTCGKFTKDENLVLVDSEGEYGECAWYECIPCYPFTIKEVPEDEQE